MCARHQRQSTNPTRCRTVNQNPSVTIIGPGILLPLAMVTIALPVSCFWGSPHDHSSPHYPDLQKCFYREGELFMNVVARRSRSKPAEVSRI